MSIQVFGQAVSRGIAIGRAVLIASSRVDVAHYYIDESRVEPEIDRLRQARDVVATELTARSPGLSAVTMDGLVDPAAGPEADALAAVERQAIELRLAGLTGREIARELGRSHEAVKMLQQRALANLRAELGVRKPRDTRHDL